jgi:nitroreductase
MEALEAIRKRRSVRKFTGELIPREDLEKIVDAGWLPRAATTSPGTSSPSRTGK